MEVPNCGDLIDKRYRLDEVLGEGASAWVFKAFDQRAQRNVALKVAKPQGRGYTPETVRRFEREVRIIANLQDPRTVTLYGSGRTAAGHLYMVFEFVEGKDLAELIIERTRLLPYEVVHVMEQILESLREAHNSGLLHRDIKPENVRVFVTPDDDLAVKLLDFGIARPHDQEAAITRAGEIVGTPRYMAPEAFMESNLTAAADIYSLGIVGMEMLFGRDALHGNDWSEQYERLITGHVFIFEGMDAIPEELMDVIEKMTDQKPDRRYQTAAAALRALREVEQLLDDPIDTVDDTSDQPAPKLPPSTTRTPVSRNRPSRSPEATREKQGVPVRVLVVLLVAVMVATALIGAVVLDRDPSPPTPRLPPQVLASKAGTHPKDTPAPAAPRPTEAPEPERIESGCGTDPLFESMALQRLTLGLTSYRWRTRLPKSYDNIRPHPVVIVFHHDDSNARAIIEDTRLGELADRENFIVIGYESQSQRDAWADPREADAVKPVLDQTVGQLCIDPTRVFLLGHGSGSHVAERLSCESWVTAIATSSYLPTEENFLCEPATPRPALHIAPRATDHVPIAGGHGCAFSSVRMISLAKLEQMWRERNECADVEPRVEEHQDGVCRHYDCNTPFSSCTIDGGFGWPGSKPREMRKDLGGCDGDPSNFPSSDVIWSFFSAAPPLAER